MLPVTPEVLRFKAVTLPVALTVLGFKLPEYVGK